MHARVLDRPQFLLFLFFFHFFIYTETSSDKCLVFIDIPVIGINNREIIQNTIGTKYSGRMILFEDTNHLS